MNNYQIATLKSVCFSQTFSLSSGYNRLELDVPVRCPKGTAAVLTFTSTLPRLKQPSVVPDFYGDLSRLNQYRISESWGIYFNILVDQKYFMSYMSFNYTYPTTGAYNITARFLKSGYSRSINVTTSNRKRNYL